MAIASSKANLTGEEVINYLLNTPGASVKLPKTVQVTKYSEDQNSMNAGRSVTIKLDTDKKEVRFVYELDGDKPSDYEYSESIRYKYNSLEELGQRLKPLVNDFQEVIDFVVTVYGKNFDKSEEKQVKLDADCYADMIGLYEALRRQYSDQHVNVTYHNGQSFICANTYNDQLENARENQY